MESENDIIEGLPPIEERSLSFTFDADTLQFMMSIVGHRFNCNAEVFYQKFPDFKYARNVVYIQYYEIRDEFVVHRKYPDNPIIDQDTSRICIEWDWIQENKDALKRVCYEEVLFQIQDIQYGVEKRVIATLDETDYLVTRHAEESLAGSDTTITAEEFTQIVEYRKALRAAMKEERALGKELHLSEMVLPEPPPILQDRVFTTEKAREEAEYYKLQQAQIE